MNDYFPREQGIGFRMGSEGKQVLRTIANRFQADNPPVPAVYCLRSRENFLISDDYMDEIRLHEKLTGLNDEDYACAWAVLTPAQPGEVHFRFSAFGPVAIYVNGELQYRTNLVQERFPQQVSDICLKLKAGENSLMFQCIATPLGCGFQIGSSSYKGRRIQFFSPLKERKGISGFLWAGPFKKPLSEIFASLGGIPEPERSEADTGISWYPRVRWSEEEKHLPLSERLFGSDGKGKELVAAARFRIPTSGRYSVRERKGEICQGYLDGKPILLSDPLPAGSHVLAVRGRDPQIQVVGEDGRSLLPECPVPAAFSSVSWLYIGPLEQEEQMDMESALTFQKPVKLAAKNGGATFWQADLPQMYLRPFNEGVLYGEWNYPLGVTLYGMIQTARLLKDEGMGSYVEGHMRKCTDFYDYCMWDKSVYGAAPFHNQLTTIDSLDDCGSFASALLEVMKDRQIPEGRKVSQVTAQYIRDQQQRLPDGTFYRNHSYMPIMNETMWADDMYMSIPFLCRYYQLEGEEGFLEDAIRQVKNFYRYLFMPELQIMSHIYDTHYQVQTKVPWGRGNGWVLFSITELLAVMPKEHKDRQEILSIYQTLCEGYRKLQDEEGMWHQVLTFPDSYRETSCTAMFIYGFSRGVRYGWLTDPEPYRESALRGWEALCRTAIDWKGNIYGVCRGSGYSFSKEYYAHELSWNVNDTHGTGIVLLAGIEMEKMKQTQR